MPGPIRTRQACDRCHYQKLRCPKQAGSAVCTRCSKMKVGCIFSPIGTNSSSSSNSPGVCTSLQMTAGGSDPAAACFSSELGLSPGVGDSRGVQCAADWGIAGLGGADQLQPPGEHWLALEAMMGVQNSGSIDSSTSSDSTPGVSQPHAVSDANPEPIVSPVPQANCAPRLSCLFLDIDDIYNKMPSHSSFHAAADHNLARYLADFALKYTNKDFMENIFTTTQRLIDLYPDVMAAAIPSTSSLLAVSGNSGSDENNHSDRHEGGILGSDGDRTADFSSPSYYKDQRKICHVPDCIHKLQIPPELLAIEQATGRPDVIDLALANQLLSCHLRLLDVLDRLILSSFMCVRLTLASSPSGGGPPDFNLPVLKVGSFTPPKQSSALIQAVLLKTLLEKLSEKSSCCFDAVSSAEKGARGDAAISAEDTVISLTSPLGGLALQFEAARERQAHNLDQLKALGVYFMNQGIMG